MICILHGYLLEGSGSNLWTRSVVESLCRAGETVHLMAQENPTLGISAKRATTPIVNPSRKGVQAIRSARARPDTAVRRSRASRKTARRTGPAAYATPPPARRQASAISRTSGTAEKLSRRIRQATVVI